MTDDLRPEGPLSAFDSPTFDQDGSFRVDKAVGSATISPCGRDVALASRQGLHIIDLDSPWSPPRHLAYHTPWEVADVQWSPFAARDYWVVSTSNHKALVWNLHMHDSQAAVEHVLHAHTRAISDINFSAHYPDILATCAVDSFVHCWDLRHPARPAITFCDWFAGATQVKWNRTNSHILASSHDKFLRIWDDRKGAHPLRSIEAHATKIYGIDWNRFETTNLVTCSLDRTVKFWDYTKIDDKPERIIQAPFPVWRARHTPFGYGLLAMPQRGDNDLHLYDRRANADIAQSVLAKSVHTFEGHQDQVKEFLWRPRGNVSATIDDRDYQLVSWGADRVLRLHQVNEDVLKSVGYQKGMEVKRTTGFTRKGAPYKTFRDAPKTDETEMFSSATGPLSGHTSSTMRLPSAMDMEKSSAPFIVGKRNGDPRGSSSGTKKQSSKDMDPISWMRGVKIGKRNTSPPGLHQSVSTITSPTLKAQPTWDVYESLGEEITAVGDKFSKIKFEDVDMQRHKIDISLSGPWGTEKTSTYVKVKIEFPTGYPNTAVPVVSIEETTSVQDETLKQILSDLDVLASAFKARRRSSLEMVLRYLLGEQSLREGLQSLQKHRDSEDILLTQNEELSSSDDDDEGLGKFAQLQSDSVEAIDSLAAVNNAQYNLPPPRACGALWADNGILVCFFPAKQEKDGSVLDQSLKACAKNRNTISEGFGRLHDVLRRRKATTSTLETIEDGESDFDDFETSSSDSSSSSNGLGLSRHHFMPMMAWRGNTLDTFHKLIPDGSQKSAGEAGTANSTTPKTSMFISLHDLSNLLPAKQSLARDYKIGSDYQQAVHNALVARKHGCLEIADVWSLIELILQDKVPLQVMHHPLGDGSIITIARHALSSLQYKDSGIDLSFDADGEDEAPSPLEHVNWGSHPFGRRWLVKALFNHFEQRADVQMLAMMSCIFSKSTDRTAKQDQGELKSSSPSEQLSRSSSYYPSLEVATSLCGASLQSSTRKLLSTHSTTSSTGASVSDQLAISYESNTPPGCRPLSIESFHRDSQTTSFSASQKHRHFHRSNSNLSAFAASFARPFSFNNSAASSPPNSFPKKRVSPSGSYLGATPSSITWAATGMFSKASTRTEDPKTSISLSVSDTEDDFPPATADTSIQISGFTTTLKNQDRFHDEGHAHFPLLDAADEWRYMNYREAYATILHAWDLPITRCELLKYNDSSLSISNPSDFSKSIPSIGGGYATESTSLEFSVHCTSCAFLSSTSSSPVRCASCLQAFGLPFCMFCKTYIRGLASPCLNCGHTLHSSCRRSVLENGLEECVSGCGCICSNHPAIEMHQPEPRTRDNGNIRDVSPAITVVPDSGINEQEMAGWQGSEWEEMAYESLARNLRGERRGSRRIIRERASQIWRGSSN